MSLSKNNKRIYQIDLFRFIAALSVVFFHYFFNGYLSGLSNLNFGQIGEIFKYGYLGVNLFFIISGFVIPLSISQRSLKKFVVSRFVRLYPTYWLCVTITFLAILFFGYPKFSVNPTQFLVNLTMFQNYVKIESIDGVYWTLFIEMKFYIFIIGIYLILNKIRTFKIDYVIYIWLVLTILNLLFTDLFLFKILNYFLVLEWSSYFISGIIFHEIYKFGLKKKFAFLLTISMIISIFKAASNAQNLESIYSTNFSPVIIAAIIFFFYLQMFLVSIGKLNNINSNKLTKIGMLTYPLYLIHQNVGFILINNLENYFPKKILMFFVISIMLVLSYIISEFYDPKISSKLKYQIEKFIKK
ncbi:acyltransferase family protein [Maribacter dokdonensis]|uniref:acyltransferase family protein n=1 Tax=Maribacter dokdonensis TaxID=320912 RepID=UPI0007198E16|nr:acyltransferase [Maribacter dokdonensis]KSA14309.1 2-hydroxy-6-oxo-6-phenylhexa-2,4-dienoate hydrolase [Maribacter dokdonensis DSW-8]